VKRIKDVYQVEEEEESKDIFPLFSEPEIDISK
jgi:hypothetical protein